MSSRLQVTSYRDGKFERCYFDEGVFNKREIGEQGSNHTGTIVEWKPNASFFTSPQIEIAKVKDIFQVLACLCKGLTINLTHNGKDKIEFKSVNGINDLVDGIVKDTELLNNRLNINFSDNKNELDFVLTYTSNYSFNIIPYVNKGETDSGPHITTIKALLTREFNRFYREKGWLKEQDENLTGDDINEGMVIVFNITAPNISYDAQTKSRIVKIDVTPFTSVISDNISIWLNRNEKDIKNIFDKAMAARKAREAAKKARDAARNTELKKKPTSLNLPTKLVDCWGKERSKCELLISEGDSAAGGLIGARDSEYQAVFPIRGKIINLFKNSSDKVFENQEVVNIIKALGLELDLKTHKLIYDVNKLRYGKIIMCCDADADGLAIRNLLLTCFWSLCPELVTNGHIYAGIPPLFRITTKKNEYIFLKDAIELEEYKSNHKDEKFLINRNKG